MPKKKFTFGNKKNNVKKKTEQVAAVQQEKKQEEEKAEELGNHLYFRDLKEGTITVTKE